MKLIFTLIFMLSITPVFLHAKKNKELGLKKIVAIGYVDTGFIGFQNMKPEQLSELFRKEIQKEINQRGQYVALLAKFENAAPTQMKMPDFSKLQKGKMTGAMQVQQMTQVLQQLKQMQSQFSGVQAYGRPRHQSVAASKLFHFSLSSRKSQHQSGGFVSLAERFTLRDLSLGDFSMRTHKILIDVSEHEVKSGKLEAQKTIKASSIRFDRIAGESYYYVTGSSDHGGAFKRNFKAGVKKSVNWIESRMKSLAWQGQIFKVKGPQYFVNAGQSANMKTGQVFKVYGSQSLQGGSLNFGSQESIQGQLKIIEVQENYSIAHIISGQASKGSVLRE